MKIQGVIIEDKSAGIFFGFIRQFPSICAQSKTERDVKERLDKYYREFVRKMNESVLDLEGEPLSM